MQRPRLSMSCDCASKTLRIVNAVQQSIAPSKPTLLPSLPMLAEAAINDEPTPDTGASRQVLSLGDVLCAGRLLVRNWERVNGCPRASLHLDVSTLRAMAEATDGVVYLYEMAGEAASLLRPLRGGSERNFTNHRMAESSNPTTGSLASTTSAPGSRASNIVAPNIVRSPVHLGTYALDDDESVIVGRGAMRHSLLLLGEVLHDIEKDLGEDHSPAHQIVDARVRVEEATGRILRLLGRINSAVEAS
ncbi:hypothetical protein DL764_003125 [Monosporascus ibericus]|uniref:Aflatoxin regulatory protein domain-containing protein n=1 Tax=Monosporascus ibericus TaxID=155417 RepID=A0A4Q4THV1_9PEZI|nr:hypothetical protein DL764_003125 [Monosporascus ibericus]